MAWPTSLPTFTPGGIATASDMNDLVDAHDVVGGAWAAYTPSWTASTTSPTLGTSTVTGRYRKMGKTVDVHISITIGTGFSAGSGNYTFGLPSGCVPLNAAPSESFGTGTARDVAPSATSRGYHVYYFSSTSVALFKADDGQVMSATAPFTWATGDRITLHIPAMEIV